MGEAPFPAIESFDGLRPNVIPERLPLLVPRPYVMALVNRHTKALPVFKELTDCNGACFQSITFL